MNNLRIFEVPYNFDTRLIQYLQEHPNIVKSIKYVYVPCFVEDCHTTRHQIKWYDNMPKTWEEYLIHIENIQNVVEINILLQSQVDISIVQKYYDIGIRSFTISYIPLSFKIKQMFPDVNLTLSITSTLTDDELQTLNLSCFDNVVLPFRYCRQLQLFNKLQPNLNYILLVNSHCLYNCNRCKQHWMLEANTLEEYIDKEQKITNNYCQGIYTENRAFIPPSDLCYFDDKIYMYKLVDRLDSTDEIIYNLNRYILCDDLTPKHNIDWYTLKEDDK